MVITRIRIDAHAASAAEVELILGRAAGTINRKLMLEASEAGELVIERDVGNPDSELSFHGRLLLHANVAVDAEQRQCRALVGDSPTITSTAL